MNVEPADPVFIAGIMPRSGTNYLWDLLCAHPMCSPAREPIREDFFLMESDHLVAYTHAVRGWWDERWGTFSSDLTSDFHRSLGDGLISFLWVDRSRRLVTKTPSVRHVGRFFTFFPDGRLIILVRDGRSVVQSAMTTFGWEFDRAAREWAAAAEEVRRFQTRYQHLADRYLLVRYEDLLDDLEGSLDRVFRFLDLGSESFDFEAARALPVRGSSFYFGPGRSSVHWEPVEKRDDFTPKERWRVWTIAMHERFEWIAGDELRHFGYRSIAPPIVGSPDVIRHHLLDWTWRVRSGIRSTAYAVRVRVGSATRPVRRRLGLARARDDRMAAQRREEAP